MKAIKISITRHHQNVRALPCLISARPAVTLHHCHGGSMRRFGQLRGTGQKTNDYLVIPIHAEYHIGAYGCDSGMGIETWETRFGNQVDMLIEVSELLGYDIFKLANLEKYNVIKN